MRIAGYPSLANSALASLNAAEARIAAAANSVVADDLDTYVDASLEMSQAKMEMGVAVALLSAQDEMTGSLLDIFA